MEFSNREWTADFPLQQFIDAKPGRGKGIPTTADIKARMQDEADSEEVEDADAEMKDADAGMKDGDTEMEDKDSKVADESESETETEEESDSESDDS